MTKAEAKGGHLVALNQIHEALLEKRYQQRWQRTVEGTRFALEGWNNGRHNVIVQIFYDLDDETVLGVEVYRVASDTNNTADTIKAIPE